MPERLSRIVLMGFMGAGKSTIGALLGQRLGWRFLDADHVLEARAGLTIAQIFALHGEPEFRRMEADVIRELLQEEELVLAMGGGAIETASTRELLHRSRGTCLVFLDAPLATLVERCESQPDAAVRPILNDRERLEVRWKARLPLYQQAHLTVGTSELTPNMVTEEIVAKLYPPVGRDLESGPKQTGEPASR